MYQLNSRLCLAAFALLIGITSSVSGVEFAELVRYVPEGANTIVTLNVDKTLASPYAKENKWEANRPGSPLHLPPDALRCVFAMELDIEYMQPVWEVAAFELGIDPSMESVARLTKGTEDELAGMPAVSTPKDVFVVKFAPHVYGAMKPARRQRASRWLREVKARDKGALSPYLAKAAGYPDRVGTEIIMALDLTDVVQEKKVRQALEGSKLLKDKDVDLDQVAKTIASVEGVTLGVRVVKRLHAVFKVDFAGDTAPIADVAKPLLLEILSEAGATIDEFKDWKVAVSRRRVSLEGDLTDDGMLRLFSLMEIDSSSVDDAQPTSEESASEEEQVPYKTKEYFDAVQKHLRGLRLEKQDGAKSYGQIGLWFQKYARRIDRLPVLNVDQDMVAYGSWTASQLRDATEAIQGVGIRSGARAAQVYPEFSGSAAYSTGVAPAARYGARGGYRLYGGGSGYATWDVTNVGSERRAIRAQERAVGSTDARAIMKQIEEEGSKVRRTMTERYKMEF